MDPVPKKLTNVKADWITNGFSLQGSIQFKMVVFIPSLTKAY
jgi:hypothetical protein